MTTNASDTPYGETNPTECENPTPVSIPGSPISTLGTTVGTDGKYVSLERTTTAQGSSQSKENKTCLTQRSNTTCESGFHKYSDHTEDNTLLLSANTNCVYSTHTMVSGSSLSAIESTVCSSPTKAFDCTFTSSQPVSVLSPMSKSVATSIGINSPHEPALSIVSADMHHMVRYSVTADERCRGSIHIDRKTDKVVNHDTSDCKSPVCENVGEMSTTICNTTMLTVTSDSGFRESDHIDRENDKEANQEALDCRIPVCENTGHMLSYDPKTGGFRSFNNDVTLYPGETESGDILIKTPQCKEVLDDSKTRESSTADQETLTAAVVIDDYGLLSQQNGDTSIVPKFEEKPKISSGFDTQLMISEDCQNVQRMNVPSIPTSCQGVGQEEDSYSGESYFSVSNSIPTSCKVVAPQECNNYVNQEEGSYSGESHFSASDTNQDVHKGMDHQDQLSSMFDTLNMNYCQTVQCLMEELRAQREGLTMYYENILNLQDEMCQIALQERDNQIEDLQEDIRHMTASLKYREIQTCKCGVVISLTPKKDVATQADFENIQPSEVKSKPSDWTKGLANVLAKWKKKNWFSQEGELNKSEVYLTTRKYRKPQRKNLLSECNRQSLTKEYLGHSSMDGTNNPKFVSPISFVKYRPLLEKNNIGTNASQTASPRFKSLSANIRTSLASTDSLTCRPLLTNSIPSNSVSQKNSFTFGPVTKSSTSATSISQTRPVSIGSITRNTNTTFGPLTSNTTSIGISQKDSFTFGQVVASSNSATSTSQRGQVTKNITSTADSQNVSSTFEPVTTSSNSVISTSQTEQVTRNITSTAGSQNRLFTFGQVITSSKSATSTSQTGPVTNNTTSTAGSQNRLFTFGQVITSSKSATSTSQTGQVTLGPVTDRTPAADSDLRQRLSSREASNQAHASHRTSFGKRRGRKTDYIPQQILKAMSQDMQEWTRSKMWPFSCYTFLNGMPSITGLEDISPDEVRLRAYEAQASGTDENYKSWYDTLIKDYATKKEQIMKPTPPSKVTLIWDVKSILKAAAANKSASSTQTPFGRFGSSASSASKGFFSSTNQQTSGSGFGAVNQTDSRSMGLFSQASTTSGGSGFNQTNNQSTGVFGNVSTNQNATGSTCGSK